MTRKTICPFEAMNPTQLPDNILKRMSPTDRKRLGKSGRTSEDCKRDQERVSEREIHRQIEQWLNSKGIVYRHDRMDRKTTGTVGWPDFTFAWEMYRHHGIKYAGGVGVEVKVAGGKCSQEQLDCHARMECNGWLVFVVNSLQEMIEALKGVR